MRFGKLDPDSLLISGYETVPIRHSFHRSLHLSYNISHMSHLPHSFNSFSTGFLGPLDIRCSQTDIKCS